MASALYYARFLEKKGATIKVELSIVHPDIASFGTDRLWGWKLLHAWVSPSEEGDDLALASRYVKSVKLAPVKNAKVDSKSDDYFAVKRIGEESPSVVYTIEVTDAALLADIKEGDGDEVYDYIEPGRGKNLAAPPASGKASAKKSGGKKDKPAPERKTYDDLRRAALEGVKQHRGIWSNYLLERGMIQRWAKGASDAECKDWLSYLMPEHTAGGAALVGLDRLRDRATDSARELLAFAESHYSEKDDRNFDALRGLVPLWWRLGEAQKAAAAWERAADSMKENSTHVDQRNHTLLSMAARGAQWDAVLQLVPQALAGGTYGDDLLVPGAVAAWEGSAAVFEAIMEKWTEVAARSMGSKCYELSRELLRRCLDRGEPEGYLELLLRWPKVIEDSDLASYALVRTEQKDSQRAVSLGERLLANDRLNSSLHEQSFGVFARHAPKLLEERVKRELPTWRAEGSGFGFLAAAGLDKELRELMAGRKKIPCLEIAQRTTDRALAVEVLQKGIVPGQGIYSVLLVHLADLGEGPYVEQILKDALAHIDTLPTKQRDLLCRSLASAAAQLGHPEIGFAAIKLSGPARRRYAASDMVAGASSIGDFTTALAALQLVPDGEANGRVSSAIQDGLRTADERVFAGPRALPLAVLDERYVRGLIAAGDRAGLEWMRAAYGTRLPEAARSELEAFLKRPS